MSDARSQLDAEYERRWTAIKTRLDDAEKRAQAEYDAAFDDLSRWYEAQAAAMPGSGSARTVSC